MTLSCLLGLQAGDRVAVVGCGGKTALVRRLAEENGALPLGVLVAPTTRMGLWETEPLKQMGAFCLGREEGEKLTAAPIGDIRAQAERFSLTLMEADGSKGLPLKGWEAHEPVVPDFATLTVGVASAKAVGLLADARHVHRLSCFLRQTGMKEGEPVTGEAVAKMILYCLDRHGVGRQAIVVNQADGPKELENARRIARALRQPGGNKGAAPFGGKILLGSLKEGGTWTEA